jgi:methyltransferase
VLVVQRLVELGISARHARVLARQGGRPIPEPRFPLFVALHALVPIAIASEVILLGARPGVAWPIWLLLFGLAQALRVAAMRALGVHWNVRIWVLPGAPRVRRGPYRWLRHPNYLAVAVELVAGPLIFGAWRTALLASAFNALILRGRIRLEEQALDDAAAERLAPRDSGAAAAPGRARTSRAFVHRG